MISYFFRNIVALHKKQLHFLVELSIGDFLMPFFPTNPHDRYRTMVELNAWESEQKKLKKKEKRETILFWITAVCSIIAAVAAVAGVVLQLFPMQ